MTAATKNAAKRSSIADHSVNNRDCVKKNDLFRF